MKTVTRSLLLSYSPISSDQLVELYRHCGRVEATADIYIESIDDVEDDKTRTHFLLSPYMVTFIYIFILVTAATNKFEFDGVITHIASYIIL